MGNRICSVEDCDRPFLARGYCKLHYYRMRAGKDPTGPFRSDNWADRFWRQVDHRDPGGCWPWTGPTNTSGYGIMHAGGCLWTTHRLSYLLHHGDLPQGGFICHHCDNRPCANPAHLYAGTPATNVADMMERGRASGARGERHPKARLTAEQVVKVRADYAAGVTIVMLARECGVTRQSITAIIQRKSWKSLL